MQSCYAGNTSNNQLVCWDAQLAAEQNYYRGLAGSFQPFHVNSNSTDPSTETFFSNGDVLERIGAVSEYTENNIFVSYGFSTSGDFIKNSRPLLDGLMSKNILVALWAGDAVRRHCRPAHKLTDETNCIYDRTSTETTSSLRLWCVLLALVAPQLF